MSASTTTHTNTVRDKLNSSVLGLQADTARHAPLGDILSTMLDVLNPNASINATTMGAVAAATVGGAVANTGVQATAGVGYVQADTTAMGVCVLALVTQINLMRTDLLAVVTELTAARVDILALRASLATVASGHVGGVTDSGLTVTSNVATLAAQPTPNGVITVRATTGGTTGVKTLRRDPTHTLTTGEVFWNGLTSLTFAAVDAVTACDVIYAKNDLSQKVSCLMTAVVE
jgi:hypothetical protein